MSHREHFLGLDLLRFFAAWLVVCDHFGHFGWEIASANVLNSELAFPFLFPMTTIGSVGVEIFFLLSGFVISASAVGNTAMAFATSRAIRVLPALWICGLVAFVARLSIGEPPSTLIAAYARTAFLSPVGPYIDGVIWTLVVEAVFYLLVFLVLLAHQIDKLDYVARTLGLISGIFVVTLTLTHLFQPRSLPAADLALLLDRFPFKVLLLQHGSFFASGMLIWSGFSSRFSDTNKIWILGLLLICTLEICVHREGLMLILISASIWWGAVGILFASVHFNHMFRHQLNRFRPAIENLGLLSYPLYLNHYTLGFVIVPLFAELGFRRLTALILALSTISTASYLIMRFPERMIQLRLRRIQRTKIVDA